MAEINPTGSSPLLPSKPVPSQESPPPPFSGAKGGGSMTEFMKLFTPEERDKFMNLLIRSIGHDLDRASKRYIEELRRERQEYQ